MLDKDINLVRMAEIEAVVATEDAAAEITKATAVEVAMKATVVEEAVSTFLNKDMASRSKSSLNKKVKSKSTCSRSEEVPVAAEAIWACNVVEALTTVA